MIFEKVEDRIKEYIINNDCIEENLHVIAVVSNTVVWANVASGAAAFGYSIIFGG